MNRLTVRDELEIGVDQAADRLSYMVLSFGLLAIVAYRSFVDREASWNLLVSCSWAASSARPTGHDNGWCPGAGYTCCSGP